jgi:hypothetical protein
MSNEGHSRVLLGIALSGWCQAQRQALVWLLLGTANELTDFVPGIWNRLAKAREAIRELEKAGHLTRDAGRLLIIESSFRVEPVQGRPGTGQLAFPEEPGLGSALAEIGRLSTSSEVGPVSDRTGCPSSDGPGVLSRTGPTETAALSTSYAVSCLGPPRSSRSIDHNSIDLDDRARPNSDGEFHRSAALELLAKDPRLSALRTELNNRKTPTAQRWWLLYAEKPYRAAQLIKEAQKKQKPSGFLNVCLQREGSIQARGSS